MLLDSASKQARRSATSAAAWRFSTFRCPGPTATPSGTVAAAEQHYRAEVLFADHCDVIIPPSSTGTGTLVEAAMGRRSWKTAATAAAATGIDDSSEGIGTWRQQVFIEERLRVSSRLRKRLRRGSLWPLDPDNKSRVFGSRGVRISQPELHPRPGPALLLLVLVGGKSPEQRWQGGQCEPSRGAQRNNSIIPPAKEFMWPSWRCRHVANLLAPRGW